MYTESTLLCNPYYLKSCGCGCSEMSLSLLFAPTPSHCHKRSFCLGGRCENRLTARGALTAHWLTRPSVTAGSGGERRARSLLGTPCGPAGGWSPGPADPTRACTLLSPHWSRLATNQRHWDSRKIPPCTRAVCTQRGWGVEGDEEEWSGTGQPSVTDRDCVNRGRARRGGTATLTRRNDPVQLRFIFALLKHRFYERKETCGDAWCCVSAPGGLKGGTHDRARTFCHTFSAVCTVPRGSRVVHILLLSINSALCVSFVSNDNGVDVVFPRNAFYCAFLIASGKHSGVCVVVCFAEYC